MARAAQHLWSVASAVIATATLIAGAVLADEQAPVATKKPVASTAPAAKAPAGKAPPKAVPAQPAGGAAAAPAARLTRTPSRTAPPQAKFRALAPGVMTTVDPARKLDEGFSRHDVIEVLSADPDYAERAWSKGKSPAKDTRFEREIWNLEFAFKPVRYVNVDVPTPDGRLTQKIVWYMVYSLKNPGDKPVAFVPRFVLASKDTGKLFPDRLLPLAIPLIRKREDPNRPLLNSIEITGKVPPTPAGQPAQVWGAVTWEDIDPATDRFAIYIQGLTNAALWQDPPGVFKKGDRPGTGREFFPKTLILSFWRPGDKINEHEEEIRFEGYTWEYGQLTPEGFTVKKPDPVQQQPSDTEPAEAEQ